MSSKVEPVDAIAAELATLQVEEAPEGEETAPEAGEDASDPEADEESEETEENEDSLEETPAEGDASVDEIRDLIDSGDLKAAAEKLGLDPSIFKLNNRQFKASRSAVKEAKAAKTEAEARAAAAEAAQKRAEDLNTKAEEVYGPVVAGRHHYKGGNVLEARAALELLFEDTFESIVANMAKGAKAMDPAQLEVQKLRRELAAEKAAKEAEAAKQTDAQQTATEIGAITAKLKGTPLEELGEEAATEIHRVIRASYNKALGKNTVTLKEAYQQVKKAYADKAAKLVKLTGKPTAAPAKPAREPLNKTKLAPRVPAGKKLTPEQEFAAELALAKKETQAAARREQRRAR